MARRFVSLLFVVFLWATPLHAADITVSAAASLTDAFTALAEGFSRATGIGVSLNFASSNSLLRQMQGGAPVDVFVSADAQTMDKAEAAGLVLSATRTDIARTDLVLVTPLSGTPASTLGELAGASFARVALGSPQGVPAGRYAQEALESAGLWDVLSARFVFGSSVRQVLGYVQRGEADAGIVYRTDALAASGKVRVDAVLEGHSPVVYPIAVASGAPSPEAARRFVDYVLSHEGQKALSGYGFSKVR